MFGKTMSLPDWMIMPYFENLTDIPDSELAEMKRSMDEQSANPMDLKKRLAGELVRQFHDADAARAAQEYFERTVQGGESPDDIPSYELRPASELAGKRLSHILVEAELASSTSEARRLINQGAVQVDGEKVTSDSSARDLASGSVLRAGRRRMVRIVGSGG
jgi:tyrosyl-tRNA synthetase